MHKRRIHNTLLFLGEGANDKCWLLYLKEMYARNKSITIRSGTGGSPDSIICKMTRDPGFYGYDTKVALIDNDRQESEMIKALRLAMSYDIKIIRSIRCLDTELLKIIYTTKPSIVSTKSMKQARSESKYSKKEFGRICGHCREKYKQFFPKETLEKARKSNKWLELIISELENI